MDGLLVGRFQPFHLGHLHAIHYALSKVENLWIGIGSSNRPIEWQNPFTAKERRAMIESSLGPETLQRVKIFDIPDLNDHKKWAQNIAGMVPKFNAVFTNDEMTSHIYSHQGVTVYPIPFLDRDYLSGTAIRQKMLSGEGWQNHVPGGTKGVLDGIVLLDRLRSSNYK